MSTSCQQQQYENVILSMPGVEDSVQRMPCRGGVSPHSDCWRGVGRTPLLPRHDQLIGRRIPDQRYGQSNCTVQVFWGTTNFRPFYWDFHRTYDQFVTSTNTQPTHPPKPRPHPTKTQPHTLMSTNTPPINLPLHIISTRDHASDQLSIPNY